jgi:lipoyl(octanoyl) transferase
MQIIRSKNPVKYAEALENMHKITDKVISREMQDTIWFLEHEPIYTVGYTTYKEFYSQYGESINGIQLVCTERGGKITYHGPGQRICYLMINLKKIYGEINLRKFLDDIHLAIINTLKEFDVNGIKDDEYPGVWIKNGEMLSKIAAIGMKVRKGVSYHGVAINVNNSIKPFEIINPCGIVDPNRNTISLSEISKKTVNIETFDEILQYMLKKFFVFEENI